MVQLSAPVVLQLWPPLEVTLYPVIDEPPFIAGALHEMTDWAFAPFVAVTEVGASGAVTATTTSGSVLSSTLTLPSTVALPSNVTELPKRLYTEEPALMPGLVITMVSALPSTALGTVSSGANQETTIERINVFELVINVVALVKSPTSFALITVPSGSDPAGTLIDT